MQAAYDLRSRSSLQPRLQPMHSGRPPLRPCTVPAKTSFSPRHTHTRIHDGGECQHNENTQTLPSRPIAPTVIPQFPRRLSVTSAEPAELVFSILLAQDLLPVNVLQFKQRAQVEFRRFTAVTDL